MVPFASSQRPALGHLLEGYFLVYYDHYNLCAGRNNSVDKWNPQNRSHHLLTLRLPETPLLTGLQWGRLPHDRAVCPVSGAPARACTSCSTASPRTRHSLNLPVHTEPLGQEHRGGSFLEQQHELLLGLGLSQSSVKCLLSLALCWTWGP